MEADIVLLNGASACHITAFSKVKYTLRGGRIIFQNTQTIIEPKPNPTRSDARQKRSSA